MADIQFSINPVDEKPERKLARPKGSSKYAPIILAFLESEHKLVKVDDTGLEAQYLSSQLKKVCKKRNINSVNVSVRNKAVYLEKK